jgi:heptose I phosphotransferase
MARTMHAAGLHHQDFYLCHFLIPQGASADQVRVIDLGRVRAHRRLARRWVTKDLAQLHFSAEALSCRDRVRFLKRYFGRPLRSADRRLLRAVEIRKALIARHTAKHRL